MDEETKAFFRQQREDVENQFCVDEGKPNPQWASVNHGCYISLEASGIHRSLGVQISFVRSTLMDSWKPSQRKLMELGGNRKLKAFFEEQGIPDWMPIAEKYKTRAAEWYRKHLRALAEGLESPPAPEPGTGHLPMEESYSLSSYELSASPILGPGQSRLPDLGAWPRARLIAVVIASVVAVLAAVAQALAWLTPLQLPGTLQQAEKAS
eukprot:TRINITY_DN92378_c0_g1_i1.p1 TRINITY_DN92378_c0_g1~~TRINITY_DN92378_c0_g1_i1.p1  ORF type:complete len:209 (-),score=29.84 TRINITY_DN92378_c0_g1_i1:545-1171(-)